MAKLRKQSKYKSDYMSRKMDERLEQLEDSLTALYANASLETQADLYVFMKGHKKAYETMTDKLSKGEITETEYKRWCENQILKTTKYKETLDTITDTLVKTDVAAMAIVRGELPFVVAQSYNFAKSLGFAAADKAGMSVGTFQVYNARSIQAIISKNLRLLPKVDLPLDKQWNKERINNAISHSIIHGDNMKQVAKRLQNVTNMDENAAMRNARTAMTGAENLGRNEAVQAMKQNGVPVKFMWSATKDKRTRDTHLLLDGTYQDENGYFGEGIIDTPLEYPADPNGDPEEIYNCRCRASIVLEGIDHSQDEDNYAKFMQDNYPDDYKELQEWEKKKGRDEERRQTKEYQRVLKEIHKKGYYREGE